MSLRLLVPLLLVTALGAQAKPLPTRRVPVVVKTLGSRYKLPTPSLHQPTTAVRDIADYVQLQQRLFPGAVITAGFYDWRTTSKYRSHAGLHLGYDVAMPYGCPFSAGWPGTVTAITLWWGEEHGITVVAPDGSSVTYGHVAPRCHIGQQVQPGEIIGTIAYNHVDVKMRDANGNYVDIGGNGRVLPAPQWAGGFYLPEPSRESVMASWLLAQNTLELAEEELRAEKLESEKRKIQLQTLRQKVPALKESQSMMAEYVEQGLVSRLTSEENHQELVQAQKDLAEAERLSKASPDRVQRLKREVSEARNRLNQAREIAARQGISWKQVENFVQATISNDKALSRSVAAYKKNAQVKNASLLSRLEGDLTRSTEQMKAFEELFEMGGISRNELLDARQKHKILEAQVKSLKAEPSAQD